MKRFFSILLLMFSCSYLFGQENPEVTKQLKERYKHVYFEKQGFPNVNHGGFYKVGGYPNMGACDLMGKEIIRPVWDDVRFYKTFYSVRKNRKVGVRDLHDQEIIPVIYDAIYDENDYFRVVKDGKVGIIDKSGKILFPCQNYSSIIWEMRQHGNGDCLVSKDGKKGVIDVNNKEIIPCKYEMLEPFPIRNRYHYVGKLDGKHGIVDSKGVVLVPFKYDKIIKYGNRNLRFLVMKDTNKWGVLDAKTNKEIIPCKYEHVFIEEDGVFAFQLNGKWGYVDTTGVELIPAQYDEIRSFRDGVAQVSKDGVTSLLEHPLKGASVKIGNQRAMIDTNIPKTNKKNDNAFAFIIANENYAHLSRADYSINDGMVFGKYCKETLGIPETNVKYYENATYGNIVNVIKKIQDIADAYDGDAKIVFYYSGLGAVDEKTKEQYLLASDATLTALPSTGYSVSDLQRVLGELNTVYTITILDASFSNVDRNGNTLGRSRGIAISNKHISLKGKIAVCYGCKNGETAFSDKKYGHGLFTYALLEQLQKTKGDILLNVLFNNVSSWVNKEALKLYNKTQLPKIEISDGLSDEWNNLKF